MPEQQEEKRIIVKVAYNYYQAGKWDRALDEYQKLIAIDPMDFLVHTMLGEIYTHKGQKDEAIKEYSKAASLLAATNNMEKALKAYHRVLKLDPNNQEARDKIEEVIRTRLVEVDGLIRRSQLKQAAEICERLDERAPNHPLITDKLAEIERRQQEAPKSDATLQAPFGAGAEPSRSGDPKREEVVRNLYEMADVYERKQSWDEAVEAYITILRFQPNDKQAREKLHQLYRRITRTDKGGEVWGRINEENRKIVEQAKRLSKSRESQTPPSPAAPPPAPEAKPKGAPEVPPSSAPEEAAPEPPSSRMQQLGQDAEARLRQAVHNRRARERTQQDVPGETAAGPEAGGMEAAAGENISAMITQAQMYISQNMLVEAMRVCQRILEFDPQNTDVRGLLQVIFEKKNL